VWIYEAHRNFGMALIVVALLHMAMHAKQSLVMAKVLFLKKKSSEENKVA